MLFMVLQDDAFSLVLHNEGVNCVGGLNFESLIPIPTSERFRSGFEIIILIIRIVIADL